MKMQSLDTKRYKGFPDLNGLTSDKVGLPFVFTNPHRVYNQQVNVKNEELEEMPRFDM
jgi:hypothetical protein